MLGSLLLMEFAGVRFGKKCHGYYDLVFFCGKLLKVFFWNLLFQVIFVDLFVPCNASPY